MDIYDLDEFVSQFEQLESYNALINEYSGTEILKEALLFMNDFFPEWTCHLNGIGKWSPEFIYTSLENLAHLQNETEYSSADILKEIYAELAQNYPIKKSNYALFLVDEISTAFDIANEDFDYVNRHLSVENYTALYKMQLNDFKKEYLNRVTFDFDF